MNQPVWDDFSLNFKLPELKNDLKVDVCVIGAGISGLSAAYMLSSQGKKVVVIDKGQIGFGETGVTTAHLTCALDSRYFDLESLHGKDSTKLLLKSHLESIDLIESIVKKEKIDCDFKWVNGYLYLGDNDKEETLDKEMLSIQKLGFKKISKENTKISGMKLGIYLKFPDQAQFHPLKYLGGLVKSILKNNGEVYENVMAVDIKEDKKGVQVKLENGLIVAADNVVVATNVPFNDLFAMHTKQAAYRTYAIAMEIPADEIEQALYWDTEEPYHYIRLYKQTIKSSKDYLIVGGEDHKTGQDDSKVDHYAEIFKWTKKNFPTAKGDIKFQWSGQIIEPIDGIAFIGLNPGSKRTYIATGFSGSGMTYGPLSAKIITDQIAGKNNKYSELYSPSRKNIKALPAFLKEGLNVASQYADVLLPADNVNTLKKLEKESGTIVSEGLQKVAVYKNKAGKVCKYSAVCPHLGCIVNWNNEAKSFDCPCHGSRFDKEGKVLNGPAKENLKKL